MNIDKLNPLLVEPENGRPHCRPIVFELIHPLCDPLVVIHNIRLNSSTDEVQDERRRNHRHLDDTESWIGRHQLWNVKIVSLGDLPFLQIFVYLQFVTVQLRKPKSFDRSALIRGKNEAIASVSEVFLDCQISRLRIPFGAFDWI